MVVSYTRFLIDSLNTEDVSALRLLRGPRPHIWKLCIHYGATCVYMRGAAARAPVCTTQTSVGEMSLLQTHRSGQTMMPRYGKILMLLECPPVIVIHVNLSLHSLQCV